MARDQHQPTSSRKSIYRILIQKGHLVLSTPIQGLGNSLSVESHPACHSPTGKILYGLSDFSKIPLQLAIVPYRSISLKSRLKHMKRHPAPRISSRGSSSSGASSTLWSCSYSFQKIQAFMIPNTMRNTAETEDPMIPPTLLKLSNLSLTAAAVAATAIDVTITILESTVSIAITKSSWITNVECPREKNVPTVKGRCPAATSRRVVRSMA
jgi:hypothetical protein